MQGGASRSGHGTYADCCGSELDGLKGVFDLEETAFRREGAVEDPLDSSSLETEEYPRHPYLIPRSADSC